MWSLKQMWMMWAWSGRILGGGGDWPWWWARLKNVGGPDLHVGPLWSLYLSRIQTPSSLESLNVRAVVDLEKRTQPLMLQRQKQTFQKFLEGWANTVWSTLRNFCTHSKPSWLAELLLADQHLFQTRKRVGVAKGWPAWWAIGSFLWKWLAHRNVWPSDPEPSGTLCRPTTHAEVLRQRQKLCCLPYVPLSSQAPAFSSPIKNINTCCSATAIATGSSGTRSREPSSLELLAQWESGRESGNKQDGKKLLLGAGKGTTD